MPDELIETLTASEGRNDGEAIASYGRSIVFLPKGVNSGQQIRVRLIELAKKDSRGRTMYRAEPAPVQYTERWKDNGDGTASRVTISTSWLLQESEEGELETRLLGKREGSPSTQSSYKLVWGNDLASSIVEDAQVNLIPLQEEMVEGGQLVWRKTGERQEPLPTITYNITRLDIRICLWFSNHLQVVYDPAWNVVVAATFPHPNYSSSGGLSRSFESTWAEMPDWWRKEQEARYPVCVCGRQRRDTQVSDGYAKCELCRAEEKCVRCGKQANSNAVQIAGKIVCDTCQPLIEKEQLVTSLLSDAHKQMIAEEAKRLLSSKVLNREEAMAIFEVTIDHGDLNHRKVLQNWSSAENPTGGSRIDRLWYYFCEDATYGSLYSPSVLNIFEFFLQASGNAIVDLVSWIANGNFYLSTQVSGRNIPSRLEDEELRRVVEKLNAGQPVLADRLQGTEKNRQAELSQLRQKWDATAGQGSPEGGYSGKAHNLESYVKEFIRLQYGVEYRNLGNAARRHSVFSECSKLVTGNWEVLRQARLTELAIGWLKDHEYLWDKDKVLKAFRAEPDFSEISPLFVEAERRAWQSRREHDFWAKLAAGSRKGGGSPAMTAAAAPVAEQFGSGAAVLNDNEDGPSAMALAFAAARKRR